LERGSRPTGFVLSLLLLKEKESEDEVIITAEGVRGRGDNFSRRSRRMR